MSRLYCSFVSCGYTCTNYFRLVFKYAHHFRSSIIVTIKLRGAIKVQHIILRFPSLGYDWLVMHNTVDSYCTMNMPILLPFLHRPDFFSVCVWVFPQSRRQRTKPSEVTLRYSRTCGNLAVVILKLQSITKIFSNNKSSLDRVSGFVQKRSSTDLSCLVVKGPSNQSNVLLVAHGGPGQ